MTIRNKIADIDTLAVEKTKRLLTIDQLARVGKMVHEAKYIDFYAFDMKYTSGTLRLQSVLPLR